MSRNIRRRLAKWRATRLERTKSVRSTVRRAAVISAAAASKCFRTVRSTEEESGGETAAEGRGITKPYPSVFEIEAKTEVVGGVRDRRADPYDFRGSHPGKSEFYVAVVAKEPVLAHL